GATRRLSEQACQHARGASCAPQEVVNLATPTKGNRNGKDRRQRERHARRSRPGPAGAEGFGRGGWVGRVGERGREEAAKVLLDEALGAEAQQRSSSPAASGSSAR